MTARPSSESGRAQERIRLCLACPLPHCDDEHRDCAWRPAHLAAIVARRGSVSRRLLLREAKAQAPGARIRARGGR